MSRLITVAACILMLTACSKPHLEIFPPLSDASLSTTELTVEQMHEDIDAFYTGVSERHPDLDRYAEAAELDRAVAELKAQITQPMNRTGFYQVVGQLSHTFNDGHSFLIWPYQELNLLQQEGSKPFPFAVEINAEGMFLKHSYIQNGRTLPSGSQLLAINGLPVDEIIDTSQRFVGGETRLLRENVVAYRLGTLLWSVFGYIDDFEVILDRQGTRETVAVQRSDNWQIDPVGDSQRKEQFFFEQRSPGLGYLYIGHFDVDPNWFEEFVDESFTTIRSEGIHTLIIDIRDNPGGNTDSAGYLASYLADEPFLMVSEVREKLNSDNRGLFGYRGKTGETLIDPWNDYLDPKKPGTRFDGEVFLLISPISYSAAIVFATTLKDYQMATLVGQTTGGFANQTAQGNLFNLPHSELRAYVPTRLLLRPSGNTEVHGVRPDIVTRQAQEDLLAGEDTEIKTVMSMIVEQPSVDHGSPGN